MNTTPYQFQIDGADFIKATGGKALIAFEMGLGKSITSLLHAFRNPSLRPIVIVTPASLKWNWERECSIHFGWRAEIVETTRPKEAPLPSKPKIVIVNYDILATRRGEGVGPGWLKALKKLNPQMLILDEVQYVSNPQTLRSKAVKELCEGVPVVIALSGTPLTNRPIELWPILNILAPDKFPSRYAFAHRYCAAKRTHWGWDFSGASNLDELNRKLQPVMIRRRKADVLKDLPAKRRSVVPMELSNPKEYEDARDDFSGWLAERDPNRMEKDDKANALVKIGHLKRLAARLKLPAAFEWLDSFLRDTDEKLVVFGIHRETIVEAIHERYANSAIVTGAITGKKRQLAIDKFLRDKKCRLFVGNIDAAGVGWSAKGVSNVVFVELPWSPGKLSQCEDRCHGIGRGDENKNTHSWTLVGRGTIEEKLADVLQKKQRNLSKILDGKGNPDDLNIFDLLIKELGKKPLT